VCVIARACTYIYKHINMYVRVCVSTCVSVCVCVCMCVPMQVCGCKVCVYTLKCM